MVIGSPGAGKSTFAEALTGLTSLPLYHLDMIWHRQDRTHIPRQEFDIRLSEITAQDKWIIDGNYQRTLEVRLRRCDTVFLFDLPCGVCLSGARERIGRKRDDMPWTETELDGEFEQFIRDFPDKQLPEIYALLSEHRDRNVTVFRSHEQADEYLKTLKGK